MDRPVVPKIRSKYWNIYTVHADIESRSRFSSISLRFFDGKGRERMSKNVSNFFPNQPNIRLYLRSAQPPPQILRTTRDRTAEHLHRASTRTHACTRSIRLHAYLHRKLLRPKIRRKQQQRYGSLCTHPCTQMRNSCSSRRHTSAPLAKVWHRRGGGSRKERERKRAATEKERVREGERGGDWWKNRTEEEKRGRGIYPRNVASVQPAIYLPGLKAWEPFLCIYIYISRWEYTNRWVAYSEFVSSYSHPSIPRIGEGGGEGWLVGWESERERERGVEDFFPHCWRGCRRRRPPFVWFIRRPIVFLADATTALFFAHRTAKIGELASPSFSASLPRPFLPYTYTILFTSSKRTSSWNEADKEGRVLASTRSLTR